MNTKYHQCVYVGCFNNNRSNKILSFFKFPVKDVPRTAEWQKNCGNPNVVSMDISDLSQKLICEKHFIPTDININNKRKLLNKNAVPVKYVEPEPISVQDTIQTYERKRTIPVENTENSSEEDDETLAISVHSSEAGLPELTARIKNCRDSSDVSSTASRESRISEIIVKMPTPTQDMLRNRCELLEAKVRDLRKKIKAKTSCIIRLKKKVARFSTGGVLDDTLKYKSSAVKTFINMQLSHKCSEKWTRAEKELALSLHYKSPGTYKFMLEKLKFTLPSIRTIQRSLRVWNLRTGVKTEGVYRTSKKCTPIAENGKSINKELETVPLAQVSSLNPPTDLTDLAASTSTARPLSMEIDKQIEEEPCENLGIHQSALRDCKFDAFDNSFETSHVQLSSDGVTLNPQTKVVATSISIEIDKQIKEEPNENLRIESALAESEFDAFGRTVVDLIRNIKCPETQKQCMNSIISYIISLNKDDN